MNPAQARTACVGLRAKTGRAVADVLAGTSLSPEPINRTVLVLARPERPSLFQPYHEVIDRRPSTLLGHMPDEAGCPLRREMRPSMIRPSAGLPLGQFTDRPDQHKIHRSASWRIEDAAVESTSLREALWNSFGSF